MQLISSTPRHRIFSVMPPCADPSGCTRCNAELCAQANRILEATQLIKLGARAGLVSQLTGLEKNTANRLYRQIHGVPSPPGQVPFMDTWFRKSDKRMLHTNIVWRLYQKLMPANRSQSRTLIGVYQAYSQLVTEPQLDLTRIAFVPQLMAMATWHERPCESCGMDYATPMESNSTVCPGCLLYHRHRCHQCGSAVSHKRRGRNQANCTHCGTELMGGIRH